MSSLINAWSIGGAVIGGITSLAGSAFTKAVSGEGAAKVGIAAVLIGGGLGLGAESAYHHWTEPAPVTANTTGCIPTAVKDVTVGCSVINGVPTYTYTPK